MTKRWPVQPFDGVLEIGPSVATSVEVMGRGNVPCHARMVRITKLAEASAWTRTDPHQIVLNRVAASHAKAALELQAFSLTY